MSTLPLAGERTRAAKRDRARGHSLPWSGAAGPPRRLAVRCYEAPEPTAAAVTLAEAEREHILGALRETGWVVAGPKVLRPAWG